MNVSLTPELEEFINKKVESGRYVTASEVVREGLRLLIDHEEIREKHIAELREAIEKGFASSEAGDSVVFDEALVEDIKARGRQRLAGAKRRVA